MLTFRPVVCPRGFAFGGRAAIALASILASVGCVQLPDLAEKGCGNYVVDEGEDCDGVPGDRKATKADGTQVDATCRPKNAQGECRYDCSVTDDSGNRNPCPDGYVCGSDSICRAPSGR